MTSIRLPLWLTATVGHSSNPLNSENASPSGTCTVYLSCAEMALPPNTASTIATAAPPAADAARTPRGVGTDDVLDMTLSSAGGSCAEMLTGVRGYGWMLSTLLVRRRSVLRLQRHVLSIFPVFVALLPV